MDHLLSIKVFQRVVDEGGFSAAAAAVTSNTQALQGTVHVLACPVLASCLLAPVIAKWRERYPKAALAIAIDPFPQSRVDEFDVTLMEVDQGYDANVVAKPLAHTEWIVCASPSMPACPRAS